MRDTLGKLSDLAERWINKRFAVPVVLVMAAVLLVVSEITYRDTTSTLRWGIALTEQRIQSMRLLQLITDMETAELGFLATGQNEFRQRYATAKAELPEVQARVNAFFTGQGDSGVRTAAQVREFTERKLTRVEQVLQLSEPQRLAKAAGQISEIQNRTDTLALRDAMTAQMQQAATLQQTARTSIYDALWLNRLAVGLLTLAGVLVLFMFLRRLQLRDRERGVQEQSLLAERAWLEAEVQRRTARLAELATHLQTVREDERAHLARELHDELGSLLTVSKLEIARAKARINDPAEMLVRLNQLALHLNKGIALKRRIIEDLRPSALGDLGLAIAMQNLCEDMTGSLGIPVNLRGATFALPPAAELAVYRFVQEALTNIGKYANATHVDVTLEVIDGNAVISVQDDGIGFDPNTTSMTGHHGLSGMQFRAESLGGAMSVHSAPGQGTKVRIEFAQAATVQVAASEAPANDAAPEVNLPA